MALSFKDCDVLINGSGILADSVSVTSNYDGKFISPIGHSVSSFTRMGTPYENIQVSFALQNNRLPNLNILDGYKENPSSYSSMIIEIAGIRYSGYLQDFSLKANPNSIIKCDASFLAFVSPSERLPEDLRLRSKRGVANYDTNLNSFFHTSTATLYGGLAVYYKLYSFNYTCSIRLLPQYNTDYSSSQTPNVVFLGGEEKAGFVLDDITYTSIYPKSPSSFNLFNRIDFRTLRFLIDGYEEITSLNVWGFRQTSFEYQAQPDGLILPSFNLINSF